MPRLNVLSRCAVGRWVSVQSQGKTRSISTAVHKTDSLKVSTNISPAVSALKFPVRFLSTSSSLQFPKAAVLKSFEKPLEIEDIKLEKLKKGEVKIKTSFSGVNSTDAFMCSGQYTERKIKLPFVPGFEVAGEISEIGEDVEGFNKGDKVVGLNKDRFKGFAEECILSKDDVWKLPQSVKLETAVALVDSYTTAYIALARRADLQQGDTVLVTAAAGGLGLAAVDLAANVYKAKVIGVCGTEDKATLVREKRAFSALKYDKKYMLAAVNDLTKGQGVRVIFDGVGGDIFKDSLECVAHEGAVIVAGFASRQIPSIQTSTLLPKSFSLIGVSLTEYRSAALAVYRQSVQDVLELAEQGLVEPHIYKSYELKKVNEALKLLMDRKSTGKIILNMD